MYREDNISALGQIWNRSSYFLQNLDSKLGIFNFVLPVSFSIVSCNCLSD